MRRAPVLCVAIASLVASACSSDGEEPPDRRNRGGVLRSHLLGMVAAPSIDPKGEPVDPSFSFTPETPEIAVVVQVGQLDDPAPVDVTWYGVAEDGAGEAELFTHTVDVESLDRAFSIGVNEGTLASGMYRVTATLAGETTALSFAVGAEGGAGSVGSDPARGDPPAAGESGAIGSEAVEPAPDDVLAFLGPNGDLGWQDHQAGVVEFMTFVSGGSRPYQVDAGVDGAAPRPVMELTSPPETDDLRQLDLFVDPCTISGGKDLPGTTIAVTGSIEGTAADPTGEATLGPDTLAPAITATSEPSTFSQVAPGDEITFEVTAEELASGGPWQTGVQSIRLREEGGATLFEETFGEAPLPCEQKSWEQTITATYTVPQDPPPIIEIVATAQDFGSGLAVPIPTIAQESRFLFYTGEIWTGTFHADTRVDGIHSTLGVPISCESSLDADVQLTVTSGGAVGGDAVFTESDVVCRGGGVVERNPGGGGVLSVTTGSRSDTELSVSLVVTDGVIASFLPTQLLIDAAIPITAPGHAELEDHVRLSAGVGSVTTDLAWVLDCESCQADVG